MALMPLCFKGLNRIADTGTVVSQCKHMNSNLYYITEILCICMSVCLCRTRVRHRVLRVAYSTADQPSTDWTGL